MGIYMDYCIVGNFGSEDWLDYIIIGSGVNIVLWLESLVEFGMIIILFEIYF